jgi:HEAT repeat protein
MRKPSSFELYLEELKDSGKPVSTSKLANLSELTPQEVALLKQAWQTIAVNRRRQIMERLVELAEENFELNFDNMFLFGVTDSDVAVRAKAAEGLGDSEEPAVIDTLISLLEKDSDTNVRARAAGSLAPFALMAELEVLRPRYAKKVSKALLDKYNDVNEDMEVRRRALEAVAPFYLPEVTRAIKEAYESKIFVFKVSAVFAMGRNCDPVWLPVLLQELSNERPEIRYEAACACGEMGEEEAVPQLVALVNDPDHQVQLAALNALGEIGGAEAKKALEKCLRSEDERIRFAAADALENLTAWEEPLSIIREFDTGRDN